MRLSLAACLAFIMGWTAPGCGFDPDTVPFSDETGGEGEAESEKEDAGGAEGEAESESESEGETSPDGGTDGAMTDGASDATIEDGSNSDAPGADGE